ncbi:preprotein translocase subunit YajC [Mariniluteicoccus flavus]
MDPTPIIFILIMAVGMWFLVIRPQKKRQTEHRKTVESVQPGARVMLASGVYATITSVGDTTIRAEIAPGVEIEVLKQAIAEIVPATEPITPATDDSFPTYSESDTHRPDAIDGVTRTDPGADGAGRTDNPKPPTA